MQLTMTETRSLDQLQQALVQVQEGMLNLATSCDQAVREREATRMLVLGRIEALVAANAQKAGQNTDLKARVEQLDSRLLQMESTHAALRSSEANLEATLSGTLKQKEAAALQLEEELKKLEAEAARWEKMLGDERTINKDTSESTMLAITSIVFTNAGL